MIDKVKLKSECLKRLEEKIDVLKTSIKEAQDSSNNETKSTAGDKHETSRAMAQLEVERLSAQLSQQEKLYSLLSSVKTTPSTFVETGAVVFTTQGVFYPSVALGVIKIANIDIMTLGLGAPVSQAMLGKKVTDQFSFNGNKYHIEEII